MFKLEYLYVEPVVSVDPFLEVHLSDSDDLICLDGVNPAHLGLPAQKTNAMNYLVFEQHLVQLLVQFDFYSLTQKPFSSK